MIRAMHLLCSFARTVAVVSAACIWWCVASCQHMLLHINTMKFGFCGVTARKSVTVAQEANPRLGHAGDAPAGH